MKRTKLKSYKPLVRKTPLRAKKLNALKKSPLKKVSKKQQQRNHELSKIEPPENGLCENCGEKPDFRGLSKHHKIFRSHSGKDTKENITWICGICHDKFHGINDKIIF